jgi:hypothetical protein
MLIGHRIGGLIGAVVSGFILRQVSLHLPRPYIRALLSVEQATRVPDRRTADGLKDCEHQHL